MASRDNRIIQLLNEEILNLKNQLNEDELLLYRQWLNDDAGADLINFIDNPDNREIIEKIDLLHTALDEFIRNMEIRDKYLNLMNALKDFY
jgi:hypothetical protein